MKLALALSERSDIQSRIRDLSERLNRNAKVQEGEEPTEDPVALMEEMESLLAGKDTKYEVTLESLERMA